MAPPDGEAIASTYNKTISFSKPPRLSNDNNLHRTISDISYELSKEAIDIKQLPPISEVEDAKFLSQAEAMREILKKSTRRAQSFSPKGAQKNGGGIARSSSCIAAITRDMTNFTMAN
ncbi:hypothetical protein GH714_020510 [Hevea brasiliensis]|uniref:Uncharacterized protein n=1 Tax=Hevea brasiliensis TaxID=3981 RepID=A0A6A6LJH1_HEVBR|nr:hypothetical protein GH714_020510 [Hevea brasiliensis]